MCSGGCFFIILGIRAVKDLMTISIFRINQCKEYVVQCS